MTILSDRQIRHLCRKHDMIEPFCDRLVDRKEGVLSYGLSSYGYDIRLGNTFKRIADPDNVLDPKTIREDDYVEFTADEPFLLEPHQPLLGRSVETFHIPRNVLVLATNKSTYARLWTDFSAVTVLEPEWCGTLTVEIINGGQNPVKIYPGEGCMQLVFYRGDEDCETSYADRKGKYQHQCGVTIPRVAQ